MIKIIHAADIHLDSPFRMEDLLKAQARKNELRAAFSSLIYWVKTEAADALLIAGDLFDSPHPAPDTVEFVMTQFRTIPNCRIFITPGNHDFYGGDSVYAKYTFPENVTVFSQSTLASVSITAASGETVNIHGYAFTSPILDTNPFASLTFDKTDEINILCAHGNLGAQDGKDCPITLAEIRSTHADYVALGHIHNSPGIKKIDTTYFGYSGSLEPRSFNDRGERGAYKIEIQKKDGVCAIRPAFFRLAKRIYAVDSLDVSGVRTYDDLVYSINEYIKARGYGADALLRLDILGTIPPEIDTTPKKLAATVNGLFYCEIVDHTLPEVDLKELEKDPTLKGELVRTLLPLLTSESEEDRRRAASALKYALLALGGNDVADF